MAKTLSWQTQRENIIPRLVIFDCDGVLVQSEELTLSVMAELVNSFCSSVGSTYRLAADAAIAKYRGRHIRQCLETIEAEAGLHFPDDFEPMLRVRARAVYDAELQPVPGVKALLQSLVVPHCVASSAPLEKVRHCLQITGLHMHFDRLFSCYEIQRWKPDPAVFQMACEAYGVAPSEAVVIEDSIPGIQAARAAGIPVYGFAPLSRMPELQAWGARPLTSMDSLITLLA